MVGIYSPMGSAAIWKFPVLGWARFLCVNQGMKKVEKRYSLNDVRPTVSFGLVKCTTWSWDLRSWELGTLAAACMNQRVTLAPSSLANPLRMADFPTSRGLENSCFKPFHSQVQKVHPPNLGRMYFSSLGVKRLSEVVRIGGINHLSSE